MKICPTCNAQLDDNAAFCTNCGTQFNMAPPQGAPGYGGYVPQPPMPMDPSDHTAEFDAKDIADNKIYAIAPYVCGLVGFIVALFKARDSRFVSFHIKQALKIEVIQSFLIFATALLAFTVLVPLAASVCTIILKVVTIICFFNVCQGKAKEPPIIKGFSFLK